MKNEGLAKVILASPPIGVNKSGCVLQPCGVKQLFNTIGNLEGFLPGSLAEHLEAEDFPEVLRQADVLDLDGINKHASHITHVAARVAATHAGDQEALLGVCGGITDETLHCLGEQDVVARGGDGVALALHTLALALNSTEVLHGMGGGTAGMVPLGIAAEDKDLVFGQLINPVGSDAVGIVGTRIGTTNGHFPLKGCF